MRKAIGLCRLSLWLRMTVLATGGWAGGRVGDRCKSYVGVCSMRVYAPTVCNVCDDVCM